MIRRTFPLAASLLLPALAAHAEDFPARKPGLWEITTTTDKASPQVIRMCTDAALEADFLKKARQTTDSTCSRHDSHRSGNVLTDDSVCRPLSSETTAHMVTTFNGDGAYTTVITSHYTPPFMGKADSAMTQDAKWLGPCGAGLVPGDMIVGGQKINIAPKP